MYPSIPTDQDINTVEDTFQDNSKNGPPDRDTIKLLKLCLENNGFEFGKQKYLQKVRDNHGKDCHL